MYKVIQILKDTAVVIV